MSDDLIRRRDAIEAIRKDIMGGLNYKSILESLPAVEAEPVRHGRWIKRDDGRVRPFWDSYRCSECFLPSSNSPFCPNCGAMMDGEEE